MFLKKFAAKNHRQSCQVFAAGKTSSGSGTWKNLACIRSFEFQLPKLTTKLQRTVIICWYFVHSKLPSRCYWQRNQWIAYKHLSVLDRSCQLNTATLFFNVFARVINLFKNKAKWMFLSLFTFSPLKYYYFYSQNIKIWVTVFFFFCNSSKHEHRDFEAHIAPKVWKKCIQRLKVKSEGKNLNHIVVSC